MNGSSFHDLNPYPSCFLSLYFLIFQLPFQGLLSLVIDFFLVHTSYDGQFLWIMFSQNITEVSKQLIRKRKINRHQTEQNIIVVLHLFPLPTQSILTSMVRVPNCLSHLCYTCIQISFKSTTMEYNTIYLIEWGTKLQSSNYLARLSCFVVHMQLPETIHQSVYVNILHHVVVTADICYKI